jgi:A/G-specific adenine glycosylase
MSQFATHIIQWQRQLGRHDLPWQNTRDAYAIWISEIMLQQTQVAAVIPYYRRFMASFPDIATLASASEDDVLRHWSGLGYYSRARNLHQAAQIISHRHHNQFPRNHEELNALPGIGRSTASAIAVFAFGQRHAILDGNVKRVLARCFGVAGYPAQPAIEKQLWQLAESLLPESDIEAYTQGLMDLGATLCTRNKPACTICPIKQDCVARRENRVHELPTPKLRKQLPEKDTVMLLLMDKHEILLEKRPPVGIWGGLWSLPETTLDADLQQLAATRYGLETELLPTMAKLTHSFTHFRLHITPQPLRITRHSHQAQQAGAIWIDLEDALDAALPTPVRKLLQRHLDQSQVFRP